MGVRGGETDIREFTVGMSSELPAVLGEGLPALVPPGLPVIDSPKEKGQGLPPRALSAPGSQCRAASQCAELVGSWPCLSQVGNHVLI